MAEFKDMPKFDDDTTSELAPEMLAQTDACLKALCKKLYDKGDCGDGECEYCPITEVLDIMQELQDGDDE